MLVHRATYQNMQWADNFAVPRPWAALVSAVVNSEDHLSHFFFLRLALSHAVLSNSHCRESSKNYWLLGHQLEYVF